MSGRESYWRDVIERQARSGESVAEFCSAERVSTASFYAWRKRLRERRTEQRSVRERRPSLVPVRVAAPLTCLEVVLPCGTVLRVPEGVTPQSLRDVLAALEPEPC